MPLDVINHEVKIGYKVAQQGEFTFQLTGMDGFDSKVAISLEGKQTGQWINLREVGQYAFIVTDLQNDDRLVIHFDEQKEVVTTLPDEVTDDLPIISVYSFANQVTVEILDDFYSQSVEVIIYSITGERVLLDSFKGKKKQFILPFATGHYLVKVKAQGNGKVVLDQKLLVIKMK